MTMTYDEFMAQPKKVWGRVLHKADEVFRIETVCLKSTTVLGERVQSTFENSLEKNYVALAKSKDELGKLLMLHKEKQEEVRGWLTDNLNEEDADLLEWRYVNCKSPKEVARLLGEQEQTVRNKQSRADQRARKLFGKI